jgi:ribonuclease PH
MPTNLKRSSGRQVAELRRVTIEPDVNLYAEGSCLIAVGNTRVLCTASVVDEVPPFLEGKGQGWITGEYAMLPRATHTRKARESSSGKVSGRTQEIQRLIGRSLRVVCDLRRVPGASVYLDCDVLQADGGTRTASVTGAYVALAIACRRLVGEGRIPANPLREQVAAVSVGLKEGVCLLDLDYQEDSACDVDMNVVMTGDGRFVEVQGTAERRPFTKEEQAKMLATAAEGIRRLMAVQSEAVARAKN